ncbi:MAG: hypothetical protein EB020_13095, partial [Proteobacteria bacterium]|nr:hypothetical protein [Pseudomonadota bacterium]
MLRTALERWDHLAVHATSEAPGEYDRFRPDRYPHGGLVVRAIARDLPREVDTRIDDWRKIAWNLDYAWFTREEAASLVPDPALPGATAEASPELVRRLGRFHLRDFVRGEPAPWPADALHEASRPVNGKEEIANVATVSSQDREIGNLIADAIDKVGKDGVVTVEEAKGTETSVDVVEGMQFDRGYLSPYFVTDQDSMEGVLENAMILL